jgi:flagellar protein FlgJ
MSIFPATDIISDVARAADPQKARAAFARLASMSPDRNEAANGRKFSISLGPRTTLTASGAASFVPDARPPQAEKLSVTQKFEAFLLQNWLETLLPKEESGSFGNGPGANVWRSMMAEQLGQQLASADCLGLNKLLERGSNNNTTS